MPLAKTLPAVILETILMRLATLFLAGAGGDLAAARHAAAHMLAAYRPETADELRLAAQIVSFSFHAMEALSQAAAPDVALTRVLRLRGSAVSLNRESDKAQRRLDLIQQARAEAIRRQPEEADPELPQAADAALPHDETQQDLRIAASLKRAEARVAAHAQAAQAAINVAILPDPQSTPLRANTM